jgi:hypothetical protein
VNIQNYYTFPHGIFKTKLSLDTAALNLPWQSSNQGRNFNAENAGTLCSIFFERIRMLRHEILTTM